MAANRSACSECGRSPLVGERMHLFAAEGGERRICELCLNRSPDGSFGKLLRTDRVLAGERPLNVQPSA
jgi:hypothetical protein